MHSGHHIRLAIINSHREKSIIVVYEYYLADCR